MNNNIEDLIDENVEGKISLEELILKSGLSKAELELEINAQQAAIKAIHRYKILTAVEGVHNTFTSRNIADNENNTVTTPNPKTGKLRPIKWMLRIAAAVLIIVTGSITYLYINNDKNILYNEIYQSYNLNTNRGSNENTQADLILAYKNNEYEAVISNFEKIDNSNNREKFLAGYSHLQLKQYGKASLIFKDILDFNTLKNENFYNDEAQFYLGLTYLKLNKIKEATQIFEGIKANINHTFNERLTRSQLIKLRWLK